MRGSAIAAVAPVLRADDNQMSVSLGTIFILSNAIALFYFSSMIHFVKYDSRTIRTLGGNSHT